MDKPERKLSRSSRSSSCLSRPGPRWRWSSPSSHAKGTAESPSHLRPGNFASTAMRCSPTRIVRNRCTSIRPPREGLSDSLAVALLRGCAVELVDAMDDQGFGLRVVLDAPTPLAAPAMGMSVKTTLRLSAVVAPSAADKRY